VRQAGGSSTPSWPAGGARTVRRCCGMSAAMHPPERFRAGLLGNDRDEHPSSRSSYRQWGAERGRCRGRPGDLPAFPGAWGRGRPVSQARPGRLVEKPQYTGVNLNRTSTPFGATYPILFCSVVDMGSMYRRIEPIWINLYMQRISST
jgi:hypothetical protein